MALRRTRGSEEAGEAGGREETEQIQNSRQQEPRDRRGREEKRRQAVRMRN